jgi:tryptophan 2,3-dioxygenase
MKSRELAMNDRLQRDPPECESSEPEPRERCASNDVGAAGGAPIAEGYSEYLKLPALLALQCPLTRPVVHDELLFIIVHQTHELWFKQILCELSLLISDIDARSFDTACRTIHRMTRIAHLLSEHMRVLETMPAREFQRFRAALGTASGIESEQFHRLEQLAGLSTRPTLPPLTLGAAPSDSVRDAFWRAVIAATPGARAPVGAEAAALGATLGTWLAVPELAAERRLGEALLAFDQNIVSWRREHFELARMMIGAAPGTGGSSGAGYLRATMARCFFPELWHWQRKAPDAAV